MTTTYQYPDGTTHVVPVTIAGLDAVQQANASERTAPRRHITVERSLLVGLLDAWQGWSDAVDSGDDVAGLIEFAALEEAVLDFGKPA